MQQPDMLVLGAGGTIGAAWMSGVLAALRDAGVLDLDAVEQLVGTSAGAMLSADLLAGVEPRAPADASDAPPAPVLPDDDEPAAAASARNGSLSSVAARVGAALAGSAGAPLAPLALAALRPGGARLRAAALARIPTPEIALEDLRERIARHGLRFDGRLRVVCVERESGKRVVFGAPGAPSAEVHEAVQASCSVPWVNRPVRIGERDYVDGAVWSPTNLDAAPALRATRVLCLSPTGGPLGGRERHAAVRAAAATAAALETLTLRRRGAHVQLVVPPDGPPGAHVRVTGYRQGLALARGR